MSSNEDSTTSESESTVRPKPFSKAPSEATSKEEEEEESKSSSSVASSDEENDEHVYYRSMPVLPDTSLFASPPDRRLDTVEELTEPLSSELFLESLGYDKLSSHTEEVYGTSEVEVSNPTRDVDAMKELENKFKNVVLSDQSSRGEGTSFGSRTIPPPPPSIEKSVSLQSPSNIVPGILRNQIYKFFTSSEDDDDDDEDETTNGDDEHSEVSLEKHELENDEKEDSVERIDVVLEERSDVSNTRVELTLFEEIGAFSPIMDNDSGIDGGGVGAGMTRLETSKSSCVWSKVNKFSVGGGGPPISEEQFSPSTIAMLHLQIKELEAEKRRITDEAYHGTQQIRQEATQKIENVHKAQSKQAHLVHRLQSKLSEMKKCNEELESKLFDMGEVSLSAQSKFDDSQENLKTNEENLRSLKVQYTNEKTALEDQSKSLSNRLQHSDEINAFLQKQISDLTSQNKALLESVERNEKHWQEMKSTFEKQLASDERSAAGNPGDLSSLSDRVIELKLSQLKLRSESEREFLRMKNEVWEGSRELLERCLEAHRKCMYIETDEGQKAYIGSPKELYQELCNVRNEKKSLQNVLSSLEARNTELSSQIGYLRSSISQKDAILRRTEEEDPSPEPLESVLNDSIMSISQLEEYNNELETEMGRLLVEYDPMERPQAVQFALIRRQAQVQDLKKKLESYQLRLGVNRTIDFDSLRLKMRELNEDRFEARSRAEDLFMEKVSSESSNELLQRELEGTNTELRSLRDKHDENLRILTDHQGRLSGLLASNNALSEEVKDLKKEVNDLDESKLTLQKELFQSKESIEALTGDLELAKHEKELYCSKSQDASKEQKDLEAQYSSFKKQEHILRVSLSSLEEERAVLRRKCQELDESLSASKTQSLTLSSENQDKGKRIKLLEDSLSESEAKMREFELHNMDLLESLSTEKSGRERAEKERSSLLSEKEDMENNIVNLTLTKDALKNEASILESKFNELTDQLSKTSGEVLELIREKSETEVKLEEANRSLTALRDSLNEHTSEQSRVDEQNSELQAQIRTLRESIQDLQSDKEELSKKSEHQAERIRTLTLEVDEEILSREVIRSTFETQFRKNFLPEGTGCEKEIRAKMELEYDNIIAQKDKEIESLTMRISEAEDKLKSLRLKAQDDLILAEKARQSELTLWEKDKLILTEKSNALKQTHKSLQEEFSEYKRTVSIQLEDGRREILESESRLHELRAELRDQKNRYGEEKTQLLGKLEVEERKQVQLKCEVENKILHFEASKNSYEESIQKLEASLSSAQTDNTKLAQELSKRKKSFSMLEHEKEFFEISKQDSQKRLKELEMENIKLSALRQEYEGKVLELSAQVKELKTDLDELRSKYKDHVDSYQQKELVYSQIDTNFNEINERYKELESNYESITKITLVEKEEKKSLRSKLEELHRENTRLKQIKSETEKELSAFRIAPPKERSSSSKRTLDLISTQLGAIRDKNVELEKENYSLELSSHGLRDKVKQLSLEMSSHKSRCEELRGINSRLECDKRTLREKMEALSLVLRSVDLGAENEGELSRAKALLSLLSELKKKRSDLMKDLKVSEGKVEASEIRAQDLERKNRLLSLQVNGYEEQLNKMKELLSKNDEQLAKKDETLKTLSLSSKEGTLIRPKKYKSLESEQYEVKRSTLLEINEDLESQLTKIKVFNVSLEGENQRLELKASRKDSEIKSLQTKNEELKLDFKECSSALENMRSTLHKSNNEKAFLRLGSQSFNSTEALELIRKLEKEIKKLKAQLSKAESELRNMTSNDSVNINKSSSQINETKTNELLQNKLSILNESINTSVRFNSELRSRQTDHVRPQVPLNIDYMGSPCKGCWNMTSMNRKVRELEDKNKILNRSYEELKGLYSSKAEELLREQRAASRKDLNGSDSSILKILDDSQSKDRIHAELISTYKREIHSLKSKLRKESQMVQSLISQDSQIHMNISSLQKDLGRSLNNVTGSENLGKEILASETANLNHTADLYASSFQIDSPPCRDASRPHRQICSTPKTSQRKIRSSSGTRKSLNFQ